MTQRTLVFGAMPQGATPQTHIASGAWCFTGQEALFPQWDSVWPLPPDPYADVESLCAAELAANAEIVRLMPHLAEECNKRRGTQHSGLFWETALAPWLLTSVHAFTERRARLRGLIETYADEVLIVPVLPENCEFFFRNSAEYMVHGIQDREFNHFVFSHLLRSAVPDNWELRELPPRRIHNAAGPAAGLKHILRKLLLRMPFPHVKGFALWQSAALSLVLAANCRDNDATIPLAAYAAPPAEPECDFLPLLLRCLPLDALRAPIPAPPSRRGRIRIMAGEYMQEEAYSLRMAAWREGGGRLVVCQHGGNNGVLRVAGSCALDSRSHALLTWGWTQQGEAPGNHVPVPHPLVTGIVDAHKERTGELILVGTEMSAYAYRLKSRPMTAGLVAYRKEKLRFFAALPEHVRHAARYRPYFAVKNGLNDGPYVQAALPDIALCAGSLMPRLLGCRMAALDHYGTTMHLALAANIPLVCYWDHNMWGMTPEAEEKFALLREAGIVYMDATLAAAHIASVWGDVPAWWQSGLVQRARRQWTESYACGTAQSAWRLTLRWRRVLSGL